ncbi:MAG: Holliday junction branch migration protein RuvA [Alphaproteobacteria bacterium]|nr:Holliday junction branch migration protein RuvA [Alphaproteobacteria bacterium]
MIHKLTGIVDSIVDDGLIIDVQGVGYFAHASAKTISRLPAVGEKTALFIEHIIRQDNQQLCGFLDPEERRCFRSLLGVQGVGVKVAIALLSVLSPAELFSAIISQDKTALTRAPGVGAKVAGRIISELKDKNLDLSLSILTSAAHNTPPSTVQDALLGLIGLGYSRAEATLTLSQIVQEKGNAESAETLIRMSLQKLSFVK